MEPQESKDLQALLNAVRLAARNVQTTASLIESAYRMDISGTPVDVQTDLQCLACDADRLNKDIRRLLHTIEELTA